MIRVLFLAIVAFALGYLARPILSPYVERYLTGGPFTVEEPEPEPEPVEPEPLPTEPDEPYPTHTFSMTGYLTEEGFDDDGIAARGDGAYQLFDMCDPVQVDLTLQSAPGDLLQFAYDGGGFVYLPGAGIDFTMTIGAADPTRTIVSLGAITRSTADSDSFTIASDRNSIGQYAEIGDAWGYVEIITGLTVSSSTEFIAAGETFEELVSFLASADGVSGSFELNYCDDSLLQPGEASCASRPRNGVDHPFTTPLRFTSVCSMQ